MKVESGGSGGGAAFGPKKGERTFSQSVAWAGIVMNFVSFGSAAMFKLHFSFSGCREVNWEGGEREGRW